MAVLPDVAANPRGPSAPRPAMGVAGYEPRPTRIGEDLQAGGREMEVASDIIAAANDRQDGIVAQAAANALNRASVDAEFNPETGFRNAKEGAALGKPFLKTYTQRFEDAQKQIRDGLLNDNQRRQFDAHAAALGTRFQSALLEHQAAQTERFNDSTDDATVQGALQSIATRPDDELGFQGGLVQINGTIDRMAQRKGMPPVAAQQLKSKFLDAAYGTRITATMQGIPGVAPANPYKAEAMFRQVQDQLSPQSQVRLAAEVQKSVQQVQARDTAQALVFGKAPTAPSSLPIAAPPLSMAPAGAAISTFGARPPQAGADGKAPPSEVARYGREFMGAMSARYDVPALTLAAYASGPEQVDKWIAQYGDPRAGQITQQDWVSKIPDAKVRDAVTAQMRQVQQEQTQFVPAPTAKQLKVDLYARVSYARQLAAEQYPGDPAYADALASRVEQYGRTVLANVQAVESGARDTLLQGIIGRNPNGSDAPQTIDALMANPAMRRAWDQATPETRKGILDHFKHGEEGVKWTPETFRTYYELLGEATNQPMAFAERDLGAAFGSMPLPGLQHLTNMQTSMRGKESRDSQKAANYLHADSLVESQLKPLGLGKGAKGDTKKQDTNVFYGMLHEQLDGYVKANGKAPTDSDIAKMAATLLVQGKETGMLWDSSQLAFKGDPKKFYVPLPSDKATRDKLVSDFTAGAGRAPKNDAELQAFYTRYRLAGGK